MSRRRLTILLGTGGASCSLPANDDTGWEADGLLLSDNE